MTVSCNCQDFDGSGQVGSLREQTLAQIFAGEKVASFQAQLFGGKLPTPNCRGCQELALIPSEKVSNGPGHGAVPSAGIMLENTMRCNLNCELCRSRKNHNIRAQNFLSPGDVARASEEIALHDIKQICYFGLGEPFLSGAILDELTTVRQANPESKIVISTNGLLIDTPEKIQAALIADYLYFSIDGMSQESLEQYQRGGNFEQSYANMKAVASARTAKYAEPQPPYTKEKPEIEWKYVLFRWNDAPQQIDKAVELAREAGIDRIVFYVGTSKLQDRSTRFSESRYAGTATTAEDGGFAVEV